MAAPKKAKPSAKKPVTPSKSAKPAAKKDSPKQVASAPKENFMQKAGEEFNKFREKVSPIYRLTNQKKDK